MSLGQGESKWSCSREKGIWEEEGLIPNLFKSFHPLVMALYYNVTRACASPRKELRLLRKKKRLSSVEQIRK